MTLYDPVLEARAAILEALQDGLETVPAIATRTSIRVHVVDGHLRRLHKAGRVTMEPKAIPGPRGNLQTRWRITVKP